MKKLKLILLTIGIITINLSCENDGGDSFIALDEGAVPNVVKTAASDPFIDLQKINNDEAVNIYFTVDLAQGTPASTDVVAVYTTVDGLVYYSVLDAAVTLPKEYLFNASDLVSAFDELSSTSDIQVGDNLAITARFTMADGTVLNILNEDGTFGVGANIQTTVLFSVVTNFTVSCLSDLAGNHSYVSSNLQAAFGYGCPAGEITGTVTFTEQTAGVYLASDLGFGQYGTSCWGDSPATSTAATFQEVCGNLISGGLDQYGLTYTWEITSVAGPELSISWHNNYGDSGDTVITREGGESWPSLFTE